MRSRLMVKEVIRNYRKWYIHLYLEGLQRVDVLYNISNDLWGWRRSI